MALVFRLLPWKTCRENELSSNCAVQCSIAVTFGVWVCCRFTQGEVLLNSQTVAVASAELQPRMTGAVADDLKLQCITFATFCSDFLLVCCLLDHADVET